MGVRTAGKQGNPAARSLPDDGVSQHHFCGKGETMTYEYDEAAIGGERWVITNDAKGDEPTHLRIVGVEERNKKTGGGSFPALIMRDETDARFLCSAYPRTVALLIKEYGTKTANWKNMGVELRKVKKNGKTEIDLVPWNPAVSQEMISA